MGRSGGEGGCQNAVRFGVRSHQLDRALKNDPGELFRSLAPPIVSVDNSSREFSPWWTFQQIYDWERGRFHDR